MIFGGKGSIGLGIGSSFIKAVKLKEAKGGYELELLHVHSLPPELIVDGSIIDSLRLIDSLKEMIKRAGYELITIWENDWEEMNKKVIK